MILLLLMSCVNSADSMFADFPLKADFCAVAKHMGFAVEKIHIFKNINDSERFAQQAFGAGWKLIRMNLNGFFKISGCTCDVGTFKEGYYQTDWMAINKALVYDTNGF